MRAGTTSSAAARASRWQSTRTCSQTEDRSRPAAREGAPSRQAGPEEAGSRAPSFPQPLARGSQSLSSREDFLPRCSHHTDLRPPRDGLSPHSTAPTCDRVRSPIRCQAWTPATASTSRYVKTPTYLTLKRPKEKSFQQGTERGGGHGCPRPAARTHPTAQEQAIPVSVSQNHQRREKGLGSKQKSTAGNGSRDTARGGAPLRALGIRGPS